MGKLILVRHGKSLWNKENRFTGWIDIDLDIAGEKEAEEAGKQIRKKNITIPKQKIFVFVKIFILKVVWSFLLQMTPLGWKASINYNRSYSRNLELAKSNIYRNL